MAVGDLVGHDSWKSDYLFCTILVTTYKVMLCECITNTYVKVPHKLLEYI